LQGGGRDDGRRFSFARVIEPPIMLAVADFRAALSPCRSHASAFAILDGGNRRSLLNGL